MNKMLVEIMKLLSFAKVYQLKNVMCIIIVDILSIKLLVQFLELVLTKLNTETIGEPLPYVRKCFIANVFILKSVSEISMKLQVW